MVAAEASVLEMPLIISRESFLLVDDAIALLVVEARRRKGSSASNTSVGDCLHNAENPKKYEETNFKTLKVPSYVEMSAKLLVFNF